MTSRERIQAVMAGAAVDRLPVWLKMANTTWRASQPEPYRSMPDLDLLRQAGCDLMVSCPMPGSALTVERPHVQISTTLTPTGRKTFAVTPDGMIADEQARDPFTRSWHPIDYFAKSLDGLRRLRWYFTDTSYHVDPTAAAAGRPRQAELAAQGAYTTAGIGPGPLMDLVEHMCGPVAWVYHMVDAPELFAEVIDLMHQDRMRCLRAILPHTPADSFWLTENTSTTLISPQVFRDWCRDHLRAYGNLVLEHGLTPVHHMCGTLNALLEMIDPLPAVANEAYTTRPLGDCSLAEGRRRMPSKALIGGTNATLWLESPETITATVDADLRDCPDRRRIFLTSAGVLPPPVSFEKAKRTVSMLKELS